MEINQFTEQVIGAAIRVHRALGPGLMESPYQRCMVIELEELGLPFREQYPLRPTYRGRALDVGYKIDLLVDDRVIVELKSVDRIDSIHYAQALTYLKISGRSVALLINFNVAVLKHGIKRFVNKLPEPHRKPLAP